MQFSKILKKKRKELRITQQDLADKLFVTRQTVSRWENDVSYPNLDTVVEISNILNLSLDDLLKGDNNSVVQNISKNVRDNSKYKKYLISVSIICSILFLFLFILGFGRYNQISNIDRVNPFLSTNYGYTVLPDNYVKSKDNVDTFVSDSPFGEGEWLKITTGEYDKEQKWALIKHKGSYVSLIRAVSYESIPEVFKEQVGTKYFKYNKKVMGPRVQKKIPWSPFV